MRDGEQIGSYRVVQRIGQGAMGEVWQADHVLIPRKVAIKVLHAQLATREDVVRRFFNEARAAASIADPGIVQIVDFGRHVDGSAYIVMELLEGETLDARMRRCGLALEDALRVVRQVATSLGAAHAKGVVHRDVKPENIFLVRDAEVPGGERPKLVDFGIAKLADVKVKTIAAAIMGTPAFMSPEQCRGAAHVDARSDVYALGCVLFFCLTGRLPFDASGSGDMMVKHLTAPVPRASTYAYVPPVVDELIASCLAKDPAERPADGHALAQRIRATLHKLGMTTSPPFAAAA